MSGDIPGLVTWGYSAEFYTNTRVAIGLLGGIAFCWGIYLRHKAAQLQEPAVEDEVEEATDEVTVPSILEAEEATATTQDGIAAQPDEPAKPAIEKGQAAKKPDRPSAPKQKAPVSIDAAVSVNEKLSALDQAITKIESNVLTIEELAAAIAASLPEGAGRPPPASKRFLGLVEQTDGADDVLDWFKIDRAELGDAERGSAPLTEASFVLACWEWAEANAGDHGDAKKLVLQLGKSVRPKEERIKRLFAAYGLLVGPEGELSFEHSQRLAETFLGSSAKIIAPQIGERFTPLSHWSRQQIAQADGHDICVKSVISPGLRIQDNVIEKSLVEVEIGERSSVTIVSLGYISDLVRSTFKTASPLAKAAPFLAFANADNDFGADALAGRLEEHLERLEDAEPFLFDTLIFSLQDHDFRSDDPIACIFGAAHDAVLKTAESFDSVFDWFKELLELVAVDGVRLFLPQEHAAVNPWLVDATNSQSETFAVQRTLSPGLLVGDELAVKPVIEWAS